MQHGILRRTHGRQAQQQPGNAGLVFANCLQILDPGIRQHIRTRVHQCLLNRRMGAQHLGDARHAGATGMAHLQDAAGVGSNSVGVNFQAGGLCVHGCPFVSV